jgi:hypothetical protein
MRTKNVVIAMLCTSIVILSIATPISAVELENSGMSGEIDGTGEVTGSVSIEASTDRVGTANVEASIEASVELDGDGSAECSYEGPVTHPVETELGKIVVDVSEDSKVEAAVEVDGTWIVPSVAKADAYVGTRASLGESEVVIESEISSHTYVAAVAGSASATASATGTTTGDGISYATDGAPNDATSHTEVSGDTEANAAGNGIAEAGSYAAVGSTGYAGHYTVEEESYIESGSYAYGSNAIAYSSANGEAYQDGQAENCASSDTYAEGTVFTAVATQGHASAESDAFIRSSGEAYKDTDYAYVKEDSDIGAHSHANSGDGKAFADSVSIGYTGAAGSACDCVYSDTSAIGIVSSAVQTEGPGSASSRTYIRSYDEASKDTDGAYVHELSDIGGRSEAGSDWGGKASADSDSIGYTGAAGSACGCVYSDTSAIGIGSTAVQTQGPASARSYGNIRSYGDAYKDTDGAGVYEFSEIWTRSHANSGTDGIASTESSSKGYTDAAGSACDCADSWTNAKGAVEVKTETDGDAWITAYARLTSDGWIVIGKQMSANSVIDTGATAMHNSSSAGTATADGSTEAGASDSCTDEQVETGILDGEGETLVNPFDVMNTNTYAGFAYATAIPTGFEAIDFDVHIDTTGPIENEAFSFTEAIAMIPASAP